MNLYITRMCYPISPTEEKFEDIEAFCQWPIQQTLTSLQGRPRLTVTTSIKEISLHPQMCVQQWYDIYREGPYMKAYQNILVT